MLVYFDRRFVGSCWSAQLIGIIRCDLYGGRMRWEEKKMKESSEKKLHELRKELFILDAEHPRCGLKKVYRVVSRWVAKIIHTTTATAKHTTPTAAQRYGKTKNNSQNFAFIKSEFIAPLSMILQISTRAVDPIDDEPRARFRSAYEWTNVTKHTSQRAYTTDWAEKKKVNEKRKRHSQALQRGEQQQPSDQSKKEKRKKEEKCIFIHEAAISPMELETRCCLTRKIKKAGARCWVQFLV